MKHILFVCRGNTCRSAMAEAIAKSLCRDHSVVISSAGLEAWEGMLATSPAVRALRLRGIDLQSHRSRRLTQEICDDATIIYGMTEVRTAGVVSRFPASKAKVHRLDDEIDIPDPIGAGLQEYIETADSLTQVISQRFKELGIAI